MIIIEIATFQSIAKMVMSSFALMFIAAAAINGFKKGLVATTYSVGR